MALPTASDNAFSSLLITEAVDPAAPAAGKKRLFVDTDHHLKTIDSSSVVVDFTPAAGVSFVGARAYNSAAQTLGGASETTITLDSEEYDTSAIHDTGSNTGRMTIPAGMTGKWRLTYYLFFAGNSGDSYAFLRKDGTTAIVGSEIDSNLTASISHQRTVTVDLTAGQYVEIRAYRTTGGGIGGSPGAVHSTFEAQFLG